jgi:hypothetical protein
MSKYQDGQQKPPNSGRKPGSINAQTKWVRSLCEKLGLDPFEVLALVTKGDKKALGVRSVPLSLRLRAAIELASYLAPKLAAIKIEADVKTEVKVRGVIEVPERLSPESWDAASRMSH